MSDPARLQRLQRQGSGPHHAIQQIVLVPGPQRGGERRPRRGGRHHEPGGLPLRTPRRPVGERRQQPILRPAGQRVQGHGPRRRPRQRLHRHQPAMPGRAPIGDGKRRQPTASPRQRARNIDGINAADQIIRGRGSGHGVASDTSGSIFGPQGLPENERRGGMGAKTSEKQGQGSALDPQGGGGPLDPISQDIKGFYRA